MPCHHMLFYSRTHLPPSTLRLRTLNVLHTRRRELVVFDRVVQCAPPVNASMLHEMSESERFLSDPVAFLHVIQ
jgi:hypothetical protein